MTDLPIEDDPKIRPEDLTWVIPVYQRVCSKGHLVTSEFNSYEVSRDGHAVTYACKRCQIEANKRQREKKDPEIVGGEPLEFVDLRGMALPESSPVPGTPGSRTPLQVQLDRIEKKLDDLVADRHPHTATRLLSARIEDLEAQIAELEKGPKEPPLEEMTFDQLKAKAASLGIEPQKGLRSAGVRKLIEERLAAPAETPTIEVTLNTPDPKDVADAIMAAAGDPDTDDEEAEEQPVTDAEPDAEPEVEVEEKPRRRRRTPQTDEEINRRGEEAVERQKRRRRPVRDDSENE